MNDTVAIILSIILVIPLIGVIVWFFITVGKSFKKFDGLDKDIQNKILCAGDRYMALVRNLTTEELKKLGSLDEHEIKNIGAIHDYNERIKTAKERIGIIKSMEK